MKIKLTVFAIFLLALQAMNISAMEFILKDIETPSSNNAIALYDKHTLKNQGNTEQWGMLSGTITPGVTIEARTVRNVTIPTLTPVLPDPDKATGAAVIVAPGGAFLSLAIEHEGFKVAQKLADQGIAAFVLKYRLKTTPRNNEAFMQYLGKKMAQASQKGGRPNLFEPNAPLDALRAIALVRNNAKKWKIDANKVGIIGFSAGAMTALHTVIDGPTANTPDFIGYIYGPMSAIKVPEKAPPLFVAIALDDGLFAKQGFGIVTAWKNAGKAVELHAYERGEHGFGTGVPGTTTLLMLDQFIAWLSMHQFI